MGRSCCRGEVQGATREGLKGVIENEGGRRGGGGGWGGGAGGVERTPWQPKICKGRKFAIGGKNFRY